jgi:Aminotransferase class-III
VTETLSRSARQIDLTETFAAHNYDPLPVVASHGDGCWVSDVDGRRYLDCLAAYSALNFGHRHPALIEAARAQLDRLTLTSRAFYNDQLGGGCGSTGRGNHPTDRCGAAGASARRSPRFRAASGIPRGSTADLYRLSRAVPCRRDPVGLGTVRDDIRLRTRERPPRHLHVG